MDTILNRLDFAPGWKAAVTGFVGAVFHLLAEWDVVQATPAQVQSVDLALVALIGVFLVMKWRRN